MAQIVFPCPNCGASQSVDDTAVSTQCQFCGNTISVPENLRAKPAAPDPAQSTPQTFSFAGATGMAPMAGMAGMAGLPNMFLNMDVNKLRAMAMAARAGDKAEAARLYAETFGVSQDEAMQAAELMANHHHVVLRHMEFGNSPVIQISSQSPVVQIGGTAQPLPTPMSSGSYNLPSPPVVPSRGMGARVGTCLAIAFVAMLGLIMLALVASAMLRVR